MRQSEYRGMDVVIFMGAGMGLQNIAIYDGSDITTANCVWPHQFNCFIYYQGTFNFELTVAKCTLKLDARF
jgi:hypothetical protein